MGNFSRDTFVRLKNYVGVRLQQGVPLVDADWNEMEDIRKYELQAFLKWYIGDGVPEDNDGFQINLIGATTDDFEITGGDGTAAGAGRCLVDGWDAVNLSNLNYTDQVLFGDTDLANSWGVPELPALTVPGGLRTDTIYLDLWDREVSATEDTDIINPIIGVETSVRLKREWVVRVAENSGVVPVAADGHTHYPLATLNRNGAVMTIIDLRATGSRLSTLGTEIQDARGTRINLGNRLNESLTAGGELRHNTVGPDQIQPTSILNSNISATAAIEESKILFNSAGHDHSGGSQGHLIDTSSLEDEAVTIEKLKLDIVNQGSEVDIAPDTSRFVLVEEDLDATETKKKFYMPTVMISDVTGSGLAQITRDIVYRRNSTEETVDVYLRITNLVGGSELVDVTWTVLVWGEEE